jgi:glyoxylase-like metal-dependent hydrolase (beta-lactamase superfamily II)
VAQESFGRLEKLGEGLYALISTPLTGDYTTVSNGGIIAGREGVLVVEAFQTAEGAEWLARQARQLTGRWPTHVLVTHHHGDHSRGVEGYLEPPVERAADSAEERPKLLVTNTTRDLTLDTLPEDAAQSLRDMWADVAPLDTQALDDLELGGRSVRFVRRRGHTSSDVTVELPEDGLAWCGDLVWNGMFPNYMDAIPSELSRAVRSVRAGGWTTWVPGHGPLAGAEDMNRYTAVIDGIEETARRAMRGGWTAEEAGARHTIPAELGAWTLFNPSYFQRAIEAWMKELG